MRTNFSPKDFEEKWRVLTGCYLHTYKVLLLHDDAGNEEIDETTELVYLSVQMLLCVIADAMGLPLADRDVGVPAHLSRRPTQVLLRRMIDNGWCRKRLNLINAAAIPYPCLYYLSSISPSHGKGADHSQCTFAACSVSTPLQPPLHRSPECICQDIRVPMDKVISILQGDGVPLVRIKQTQNVPELEVVEYTVGMVYIAISHV